MGYRENFKYRLYNDSKKMYGVSHESLTFCYVSRIINWYNLKEILRWINECLENTLNLEQVY